MYCLYKQLHPPTGIEHSVYCNLISPTQKHLVVSSVNTLNIYRLIDDVEPSEKSAGDDTAFNKLKLECISQHTLFGNIYDMRAVRMTGNTCDSLLLSFQDAKASLVEYDSDTHDLRTCSLHYFEHDQLKGGLMQHGMHHPMLRTDPDGRCAAMLVYGSQLVILPYRCDISSLDTNSYSEPIVTADDSQINVPHGHTKSPIMPSYVIDLKAMDDKITNIIDIQFLPGYYEPTLFILYEPLPTWAGRIAVRKDSCSIAALSINLQQKVHPVIWSLSGLPFDCEQVIPVPKPIGGVLLFAVNSLLYLNQSVPPYGVSLNAVTNVSTDFLLKQQEGVCITLDCAKAVFISNERLVISLKGGELYVLTLMVDSMRSVRSFDFDKAASSVLATCMSVCEPGYLFLGSRLGNSLLLKYTEKSVEDTEQAKDTDQKPPSKDKDEPSNKKRKTDNLEEWIASDVSKLDILDELEVYGSEVTTSTKLTSYSFQVCDSMMNIGPCGKVVMGEPAFLSEEFHSKEQDIELVMASGHGKNGALSVLQRTIRPQIVTTFELPGCIDMWTLLARPSPDEESNVENARNHAYLVLSKSDSCMVLETGQEIMEIDQSGFLTNMPTLYAGNIGNDQYIVQVTPMSVVLLEGVKRIQNVLLDMEIVSCSVADPYIVLLSTDGELRCLQLIEDTLQQQQDTPSAKLDLYTPPIHQPATAVCCYCDVSGIFRLMAEDNGDSKNGKESTVPVKQQPFAASVSVDDEEELLYGDSSLSISDQLIKVKNDESTTDSSAPNGHQKTTSDQTSEARKTYWMILVSSDGIFKIYSMTTFKQVFACQSFNQGHGLLSDEVQNQPATPMYDRKDPTGSSRKVKELLMCGLGNKKQRPHLLARINEEVLVYEAFPFHTTPEASMHLQANLGDRLKIRFKLLPHNIITRKRRVIGVHPRTAGDNATSSMTSGQVPWFRVFDDIAGYSGVFICSPYPHWLIMTYRGILRAHPMSIDGSVRCFAQFQNINCPKGFLYFNHGDDLRISVLPTHLSYDAPWPVRKVPLRRTVYDVVYHPDSKTYCVVSSVGEPCKEVVHIQNEGEKETETVEKDDERFILPLRETFTVQLFSPVSWEAIPNTDYTFEDFENVTCSKYVKLKSEGTVSGLKGYMAIGTNYSYSEDVTSRGRIIVFDIIDVVPEPGQPLTKNKMKIEYDKEQKGPVTALDCVSGFLITAIGQKVYIWQLINEDLIGVAFIDTQVYIHSISVVRSLILMADVTKSVTLLRYKEDLKVLSLISRDMYPLDVYAAEFMIDNTNLCAIASDNDKNLVLFAYLPEVRESSGGQWLLRRGDFNCGSHINTFWRIKTKVTDPSTSISLTGVITRRQATFFATLDGSLGYVLPLAEKLFRRLNMLQTLLIKLLPHYAGLNPKSYRQFKNESRMLMNIQRGILDGDLIWKYLHVTRQEKVDIASKIGTTTDQLMDDLMELDRCTAHF